MAKKVRKPRSQSPRTYAQANLSGGPAVGQPTPKAEKRPAPAPAPAARRPATASAPAPAPAAVDWQAEYGYVFKDLRRTFILAVALLALLVAANFALQAF
ncbi:MAG: hypothetical protein NZ528_09410 [Caldilineales bacterium]|nr:hypothetical protein [Caldilineales bacterium]MDW8318438.1 hypothetical protein [Anaerolineae bacterium]